MRTFVIGFITGGAIGAGVTYLLVKNKLQKQADKQVEDAKAGIQRYLNTKEQKEKEAQPVSEPPFDTEAKPTDVSQSDRPLSEDEFAEGTDLKTSGKELIDYAECGMRENYDVLDWCVFTDGFVCVDDIYKFRVDEDTVNTYLPENWQRAIGNDADHPDCVCFRNHSEELDISIVSYPTTYKQWLLDNDYESRYKEEFEG